MLVSKKGGGGESGQKTGELLRAALTHLDDATYRHRMDGVIRLVAISMGYYVRQKTAFRRSAADLFLNNLFDAMVGLLSAPISPETKAAQKQTKRTNK
jgi:hypothetical protein